MNDKEAKQATAAQTCLSLMKVRAADVAQVECSAKDNLRFLSPHTEVSFVAVPESLLRYSS